jgi:hypothetical protein
MQNAAMVFWVYYMIMTRRLNSVINSHRVHVLQEGLILCFQAGHLSHIQALHACLFAGHLLACVQGVMLK